MNQPNTSRTNQSTQPNPMAQRPQPKSGLEKLLQSHQLHVDTIAFYGDALSELTTAIQQQQQQLQARQEIVEKLTGQQNQLTVYQTQLQSDLKITEAKVKEALQILHITYEVLGKDKRPSRAQLLTLHTLAQNFVKEYGDGDDGADEEG